MICLNPSLNPLRLASSSVSGEAYIATVGENALIMEDRVRSLLSERTSRGEAVRPIAEAERESLPLGEPDLENSCDVRLVRDVDAAGLEPRKGRLAVEVWGDSSLSGSLIFGTWRGIVEEGGGGDWTVSPSSGDVMDLAPRGMFK